MGYVLHHAVSLVYFVALLVAGGVIVEAWWPRVSLSGYRSITCVVLGLLFWVTLLFLCASIGLLRPWPLRAVSLLVLGTGVVLMAQRPASRPTLSISVSWVRALPAVVVLFALGVLFVQALRPDNVSWDASAYHLTVPRLYLEHGGFRPIRFNVYSNWPMNEELLFALGMALDDYLLATLVHWLFAVLTVWALLTIGRNARHADAGVLAACLFLANEVVLWEAGVAYVDLSFAFLLVMAVAYAFHAERRPDERRQALLLCGICCGLMAGVKLNGVVAAAIVIAVTFWSARRRQSFRLAAAEVLSLVAVPCLAIVLPWYVKSAWYTGNPFYPFFYNVFRGVDWSARLGAEFQTWQASIGMGRTVHDYLLLPLRVAMNGDDGYYQQFDGAISRSWLVSAPLVLVWCWRSAFARRAGAVSLLFFFSWAISSQQLRFLIPALAVLALAAAVCFDEIVATVPWRSVRQGSIFLAGLVVSLLLLDNVQVMASDSRFWLGQFQAKGLALLDGVIPPIDRFINANLAPDARVLFIDTNTGFFCHRDFVADSFFEASQVNTFLLRNRRVDEIQAALHAEGFTHVLTGHTRWNIQYPPTFNEFLSTRARLVYMSPLRDRLYELLQP